jgi:glycine/D-amino acid oxidase-like deaminating enzyme
VELLDGDEIVRRFPWMTRDVAVGTFRQRDGWLDATAAAVELAAASGAPVHMETTVTSIDVEAGRVTGVTTDRGRISTRDVVLAAGPLSRTLAPEPLPVALWRRHRIVVPPDSRVPVGAPMTIDANTGAHWRPHRGGAMVAWAQPETDREATWPVETDPAWPDLALRSARGVGRLSPFWRELAAGLTPDGSLFTAGLYTVTPDHKPLIGPANATDGLWLNTGYSGHGVMGAPSGSRLLADVMASRVLAGDNPFHPGRFAAGTKPPDLEQIVL